MPILYSLDSPEPLARPAEDPARVRGFRIFDPRIFEEAPAAGAFCFQRIRPRGLFSFRFWCPCGCMAEGNLLVGQGYRPEGGWFWDGHFALPTLGPAVAFPGHLRARLDMGIWHLDSPGVPPRSFPL